MPSSEPLEMTIATFSIVFGTAASSCGCSSVVVIVLRSFLDAAAGLRNAADLGGELGRAFGEELVELLDRDARLLAERADRGGGAGCEVAVAHEVDDQPVTHGQLDDAVLACDLLSQPLVPLVRVGQEALRVGVEARSGDQGCSHLVLLQLACTGTRFLPAVGIAGPRPGISHPGSNVCQ